MKTKVILMLIAVFCQLTTMSSQSNNCIPEVNFPGGRVIMSFDGNKGDDDDIVALPFAMALWDAAGLKNNVVQIEYNNNICGTTGKRDRIDTHESDAGMGNDAVNMRTSANEARTRFGYRNGILFDFETQATASTRKMTEEIEKSTQNNPLWIIAAGPMETIYRGMNAATKGHDHVTVISHGRFNQNSDACNGHTWDALTRKFKPKGVFFVGFCKGNCNNNNELPTQNGGFNNSINSMSWLKNSSNEDLAWLFTRNPFTNKFDPSDAGMAYYLINGGPFDNGKKTSTVHIDARKLLENPCNGSNPTPTPTPEPTDVSIPAIIEAEDFNSQKGVEIQDTPGSENNKHVGSIKRRDFIEFKINVPKAATYFIDFYVANQRKTTIRIQENGNTIGNLEVNSNNSFTNYRKVTQRVQLTEGNKKLRFIFRSNSDNSSLINIDRFEIRNSNSNKGLASNKMDLNLSAAANTSILSPSPVFDILTASGNDLKGKTISVCNMNGNLMYNTIANSNEVTLNLSGYTAGIYIVTIQGIDGSTTIKKIVKK